MADQANCISMFLAKYPVTTSTPMFWLGFLVWAGGLYGNFFHEEILYDLRRGASKDEYKLPKGGLFRNVSFPHYFSEWTEWIGFSIAAEGLPSVCPPWTFVVAEFVSMAPR